MQEEKRIIGDEEGFAEVGWCVIDIRDSFPEFTREQAVDFLIRHEDAIRTEMIQAAANLMQQLAAWDKEYR